MNSFSRTKATEVLPSADGRTGQSHEVAMTATSPINNHKHMTPQVQKTMFTPEGAEQLTDPGHHRTGLNGRAGRVA